MNPLRIIMLAPFGMRPKATLSARMLPLAQALVRRGHTVAIHAPPIHNPQDAGRREVHAGVIVQHNQCPTLPGPAGVLQQVLALAQPALHTAPDVLHLFKPKGYSGLAARLLRALRPTLPLVVDTDDWEGWGGWNDLLPYPYPAKAFFAWQERDLPRHAAAVTVASRTLETQVWGFGVPPTQVVYVPNGVTREQSSNAPTRDYHVQAGNPPTILLYTRFWEFSVRDVVAALVPVVAHHPQVRLRVVGRGERGEEQELLRLATRAGLAQNIDYHGWVEPHTIPAHFAAADVAIYPIDDRLITRAKCSAKLLEMLAAGLPVVAGRVGQVSEMIDDGVHGLLVPPGDAAGMARGILRLLEDTNLCQRLGMAACARMQNEFTWDTLVTGVERAYHIARSTDT